VRIDALLFFLFASIAVSAAPSKEDRMRDTSGIWVPDATPGPFTHLELFEDGSCQVKDDTIDAAGTWTILSDGRIKVTIGMLGTTRILTGEIESPTRIALDVDDKTSSLIKIDRSDYRIRLVVDKAMKLGLADPPNYAEQYALLAPHEAKLPPAGKWMYGWLLVMGHSGVTNVPVGLSHLSAAADADYLPALFTMGVCLGGDSRIPPDYAKAKMCYHRFLELRPTSWEVCNALSWLYATCPDASIRSAAKALEYSNLASELPNKPADAAWRSPGTMAAVHMRSGNWIEAEKCLRLAVSQWTTGGLPTQSPAVVKEVNRVYSAMEACLERREPYESSR